MNRLKNIQAILLAIVAAALLVAAIYNVQKRLTAINEREGLTPTAKDDQRTSAIMSDSVPPVVAFTTVALGSFRGLVADWLWLRSMKMQEEGNYFEMFQLASWIVKLQPRFTGATAFLAWNMAYNISVNFSDYEDRWRWVQRGIELIRDEALFYNPGDPELFKELGWIYQHKVGQDLDDANRYYKTQMAMELMTVLGGYPPDWVALSASPVDEKDLLRELENPQTLQGALEANELTFSELEKQFREDGEFPEAIGEALAEAGIRQPVALTLRHRWLLDEYKLDPQFIQALNADYGDLDWRLPEAHAIYWARRGREVAGEELSISCDRMIFQSLNHAFKRGRLIFLKDIQYLETTPNVSLVDAVEASYQLALDRYEGKGVKAGYENFLIDATVILYTFGQREKAAEYFRKGRVEYGRDKFAPNLDEFVLTQLTEDISMASYDQAQSAVQGYLFQACHSLATAQFERANTYETIARRIYLKYMKDIGDTKDRRGLPPYPQMKKNVLKRAVTSFPAGLAERLRTVVPQVEDWVLEQDQSGES